MRFSKDVPEVWFWEDGLLKLYHLQDGSYEPIERSQLPELSELDLDLTQTLHFDGGD